MKIDPYVRTNIYALVAIDGANGHGHADVDHRTIAALSRRGLIYMNASGYWVANSAGCAVIDAFYAEREAADASDATTATTSSDDSATEGAG